MSYAQTQRDLGLLTVAEPGLKCQGNTPYSGSHFRCAGDNGMPADAVHTWEGRHYCLYHSPFDAWEETEKEETVSNAIMFWTVKSEFGKKTFVCDDKGKVEEYILDLIRQGRSYSVETELKGERS